MTNVNTHIAAVLDRAPQPVLKTHTIGEVSLNVEEEHTEATCRMRRPHQARQKVQMDHKKGLPYNIEYRGSSSRP